MKDGGGYIENLSTCEKMKGRLEKDVSFYDAQMEDGDMVTMTLDSGAGYTVWPKGLSAGTSTLRLPRKGMTMVAANGTPIDNFGQRLVLWG